MNGLLPQLKDLQSVPRSLFVPDPRDVAPLLLGKILVRRQSGVMLAGRIVELEAYLGNEDPAAHAAAGRTARNHVLFGPPGYAYVYFIYGNHYCLNVSCMPEGEAGCLLFRALEPLCGIESMAAARNVPYAEHNRNGIAKIAGGPGRLTQALGITRAHDNGKDLIDPAGDMWIADDGFRPAEIASSPRIGITKAAQLPLRYFIRGSRFVSGARRGGESTQVSKH